MDDLARQICDLILARPPTLAGGRVLAIDGLSGSGKSTLADAVIAELPTGVSSRLVRLDDCYDGWDGLASVGESLRVDVLQPLSQGATGSYRRYDWQNGRFGESVSVPAAQVLVVEGVGAGSRSLAEWTTLLIWVDSDPDVALERAIARDGEVLREELVQWRSAEAAYLRHHDPRSRADLIVHLP